MRDRLFYVAFWLLFMGSGFVMTILLLNQIERNTRG